MSGRPVPIQTDAFTNTHTDRHRTDISKYTARPRTLSCPADPNDQFNCQYWRQMVCAAVWKGSLSHVAYCTSDTVGCRGYFYYVFANTVMCRHSIHTHTRHTRRQRVHQRVHQTDTRTEMSTKEIIHSSNYIRFVCSDCECDAKNNFTRFSAVWRIIYGRNISTRFYSRKCIQCISPLWFTHI